MTTIVQPIDPTSVVSDTGVVIGWLNLDIRWNIEIERAPDSSGSPDTANSESTATVPGGDVVFVDREVDKGEVVHYRIRTKLEGCSAGPWSDWQKATGTELPDDIPDPPTIREVWELTYEIDQIDSSTSRLTLELADPEKRLTAMEFRKKPGGTSNFNAWESGWDNDKSGTIGSDQLIEKTEDLDLHPKHNAQIQARFTYDTREGGSRTVQLSTLTGDRDRTPEITHFSIRIRDSDGAVLATVRGDDDVVKVYGRFKLDATPADPDGTESDSTAGQIVVNSASFIDDDTGLRANQGQTVHGKVRAENADGSLGPVINVTSDRVSTGTGLASLSLDQVREDYPNNGEDTYDTSWSPTNEVTDNYTLTLNFLRSAESIPASPSSFDADGTVDETSPLSTTSRSDTVTSGGTSTTHKVEWVLKDSNGNVVDSGLTDQSLSFA